MARTQYAGGPDMIDEHFQRREQEMVQAVKKAQVIQEAREQDPWEALAQDTAALVGWKTFVGFAILGIAFAAWKGWQRWFKSK